MPLSTSDEQHARYEQRIRQEMHQRLMLARQRSGLNNADIARALHAAESSIGVWFMPKRMALPEGIKLLQLPAIFDVNGHWLLTGLGEMTNPLQSQAGPQYLAGAQEIIARTQLFQAELLENLAKTQRRGRAAVARKDVEREILRTALRPTKHSGDHSR